MFAYKFLLCSLKSLAKSRRKTSKENDMAEEMAFCPLCEEALHEVLHCFLFFKNLILDLYYRKAFSAFKVLKGSALNTVEYYISGP